MENLPPFGLPDILAIAAVVFGVIQGIRRGLSGEVAGLVAVTAALVAGLVLYKQAGGWLMENTRLSETGSRAVAFLVTVLCSGAVMLALALLLRFLLRFAVDKHVDRAWGAVIGMVRSIIGILIFFIAVNLWPHPYLNRVFGEESLIGGFVVRFLPELRGKIVDPDGDGTSIRDKAEHLIMDEK